MNRVMTKTRHRQTNGTVPAVTYAYDSWGNLLSVSGDESLAASLRFTWQGREYSRATALYNFRARWYDPAACRWLSKDPIGLEGGLNLYEAFGSNPVCFWDPEGESGENKIDGMNVRVHLKDVDSWPSTPHGDVVGERLKIDVDGKIWSRQSKKVVGKLSKKGMVKFLKLLTKVTGGVVGFILTPTAMGDGELPIEFRERNTRPPTSIVVPPQRDETKPSKNPNQPNSLYLLFAASTRGVKECA